MLCKLAASCSAATIAGNSIGYAYWVQMALPSLMYMHSNGICQFQSSVGRAMAMLAPTVILLDCDGPLSARKFSSYS